ncbi:hypothetical protein [Thioalkalivibrio sp. ALJ7]|uniref:hypothetical protein n=1 Tax=Thioalkalivibrio sp. ALJ7 TaxID=1158756 RepID=UPI00037E08D7|nr:hypothetical protein [Thioalkalivibrio sp. ALJ7]
MAKKQEPSAPIQYRSTGRPPRYLIVLLILAALWAGFWGIIHLQSGEPESVTLDVQEQAELEAKLQALGQRDGEPRPDSAPSDPIIDLDAEAEPLVPELYEERAEAREVRFSERELNAMIAQDLDLAGRVAIRLTPGQVSTRVRIDVPADIPLLGGRVLNVRSGVRFGTEEGQVYAHLVGVSVAGIPLPDAWLGGLKDEDLLALEPFQQLRAGVESIEVRDGELALQLAR